MNEELIVGARYQLAPTTSLPFVHTARRSYRLDVPASCLECGLCFGMAVTKIREPQHLEEGEVDSSQDTTETAYLQLLQEDQAHGFNR